MQQQQQQQQQRQAHKLCLAPLAEHCKINTQPLHAMHDVGLPQRVTGLAGVGRIQGYNGMHDDPVL
jgi:hypothetical protein